MGLLKIFFPAFTRMFLFSCFKNGIFIFISIAWGEWNWALGKVTFLIQFRLIQFLTYIYIQIYKYIFKKVKKRIKNMKYLTVHSYQSSQILVFGGRGVSELVFHQTVRKLFSCTNHRFSLHVCGIFNPKELTAFHLLPICSVFTLCWSTAATVSGAQIGNVFNCV